MIARRRTLLAGVLAMLALAACVGQVDAQSFPLPPNNGLGSFFDDPRKWVTDVFNAALLAFGQATAEQMMAFMDGLLGGTGNVINQTPADLSYESSVVLDFWRLLRNGANVGLGSVAAWSGINMIVRPNVRAPYNGALELIPRLLIAAVLVNTSLGWGGFAIKANNALCTALGLAGLPGWRELLNGNPGGLLMNLIALLIYLVMGALLLGQMLMRLALVDVLLIISPIALLCWVLPQTYSWARLWFTTFFGTVFVQFLQVAVLHLGSRLMQDLVSQLPTVVGNPIEGGGHWVASLLLGISVLQLARKLPRLMPGYPAVGASTAGIMLTRLVTSTVLGQRERKGSR